MTVTAPAEFEGQLFTKWMLGGTEVSRHPTLFVELEDNLTLEVIYIDKALAGRWSFDDLAGIIAADSSGHGLDGYLGGGTAWTDGVHRGGALSFDGINSFMEILHSDQWGLHETAFTLALWVRTERTTPQALIEKAHNTALGTMLFALNRHPLVQGGVPSIPAGSGWIPVFGPPPMVAGTIWL